MNDYFDLSRLPELSSERQVLQVSSFDRKGENADFEQFLYQDKDGSTVLFDDRGKGCVKSIWAAIVTDESLLSFYFDGSDTPRFTVTLQGLFTGKEPSLSGPGVSFERTGWGHPDPDQCRCGNCMIPIPYEKGLKITLKGKTDIYYHILYEKYDADYDMSLFDGKPSEAFTDAFAGKRSVPQSETFETEVSLSKMYTHVFVTENPGVITSFTVEAPVGTDLSKIQADIVWDGELISQVAAPLLYLFAMPLGFTEIRTHAVSTKIEDGKMILSLFLPMPYWKSADITFINLAENPEENPVKFKLRLGFDKNGYDRKNTGYFHADYRKGLTELFGDWLIGDFFGRGSIVGVVQTCHGGHYCEGNEHFYINGAMTPQINGTGTEDFYLGCYWPNRKYDFPFAGCVNDIYAMNGGAHNKGTYRFTTGYYRFLHDCPISFTDGIRLCIQHGSVCETYSDYSSLCLSYRQPDSLMTKTDFINTGSETSKALHAYLSEGEGYVLAGKVEMERRSKSLNRKGMKHKQDVVCFNIAVDPENSGVCLRRIYDQSLSPQGGKVFVDGSFAGEWHNPAHNDFSPFADSDFYIPASLSAGKAVLKIEIAAENAYSDFEYTVFSLKKPE